MLEQYKKSWKASKEKKINCFVSDKFENYKSAWKTFSRITKINFGVPIACKKFGLNTITMLLSGTTVSWAEDLML